MSLIDAQKSVYLFRDPRTLAPLRLFSTRIARPQSCSPLGWLLRPHDEEIGGFGSAPRRASAVRARRGPRGPSGSTRGAPTGVGPGIAAVGTSFQSGLPPSASLKMTSLTVRHRPAGGGCAGRWRVCVWGVEALGFTQDELPLGETRGAVLRLCLPSIHSVLSLCSPTLDCPMDYLGLH